MKIRKIKKLGQVFLNNHEILEREAEIADVKNKIVLEIGSGDGRLTEKLLKHNPKKVIAIEKDARFAEQLKERFADNNFSDRGDIDIINADFLELDLELINPKIDVIIGNIPYYISSQIIFKIKSAKINHAILMVQKEFAEKMIAKPNEKNYGRLSVTSQIFFNVQYLRTIPKSFFSPKPKVDSALIKLIPTGTVLSQFEEDVIRNLFQHKNKTVRNALKDYEIDFEAYSQRRVRTLTKEDCLELAKNVKKILKS